MDNGLRIAEIRAAILDGDIDKALKHTNAYYPSVLRDNENIYFKLRCRKFIEMIRQINETNAQFEVVPTPPSKRSTASNKRNSTATDDYDFEMELDEQLGVHNPPPSWDNKDDDELEDEDDIEDKKVKLAQLTQDTIIYGQELKAEFQTDPRREVKRALEDTFALIAYEDARASALAPLLETSGRVPVAEELNSAILGMIRPHYHQVWFMLIHHSSIPRKVLLRRPRTTRLHSRSSSRRTRHRWRTRCLY